MAELPVWIGTLTGSEQEGALAFRTLTNVSAVGSAILGLETRRMGCSVPISTASTLPANDRMLAPARTAKQLPLVHPATYAGDNSAAAGGHTSRRSQLALSTDGRIRLPSPS
eukprot:scaffold65690_cov29-Tisochrysis_lutea.AAC.2